MTARTQQALTALGALAGLAALLAVLVYLGSEAKIARRYTLPSSIAAASEEPGAVALGGRLAMLYGCRDCHTAPGAEAFTGQMLYQKPGLRVAAPNLRRFAAKEGAAGFDIAVRRGMSMGAKGLWDMPSGSYSGMRDADLQALIAYFLTLQPDGPLWPEKRFSFRARLAVLAGTLVPSDPYNLNRHGPRYMGPQYEGGQYIATMACSSCHGSDLNGVPQTGVPDLRDITVYSRGQFFRLLREGVLPPGHTAPQMVRLSARRFRVFKDYEINALYDYLSARAGQGH